MTSSEPSKRQFASLIINTNCIYRSIYLRIIITIIIIINVITIIITMLTATIKESKQFHKLEKYPTIPKASSLSNISTQNVTANV